MKTNTLNTLKLLILTLIALVLLAACGSPELRQALGPVHKQTEVGMLFNEVKAIANAEDPEIQAYDYAYTSDHSGDFGLDPDKVLSGTPHIMQVTRANSKSICFFKVLFVDGDAGERQAISISTISCPT